MVDGKPTYDVHKAPAIIEKQVQSIENLMKEDAAKTTIDEGLIERYKTAILFYKMLAYQIDAENKESK